MGIVAFTPADTVTDALGVARAGVSFGPVALTDRLVATADGVGDPAIVDVAIAPGPANSVFTTPSTIRLLAAGDSATFQVWVQDRYLNGIKDAAVNLRASDSTLLSITPPLTWNGNGIVRALKGVGSAAIAITSGAQSAALNVTVKPLQTNCGGSLRRRRWPGACPRRRPTRCSVSRRQLSTRRATR